MVGRFGVVWTVAIAAGVLGVHQASAQEPATSFAELKGHLHPGETVRLTDSGRTLSKGTFAELSGSSIRLLVDGIPRDFAQADIWRIDANRQIPCSTVC